MAWFDDLKTTLPAWYAGGGNIVGYLRGSASPSVWRSMERASGQMIVLGSKRPSKEEWDAAGVGQRGEEQVITLDKLAGFIILYGGFMYRPWGHIYSLTPQTQATFTNSSLASWKRNYMKPRP